MSEQDNVQLVQDLYAAFMRGDIAAILSKVANQVDWFIAGPSEVAYAGRRGNPEEVTRFFQALNETLEVEKFEPREYIAQGDRVVALGTWSARVKETGRPFHSEWAMVWTVQGGKITSFHSYEDTHAIAAAYRGT